jgi:hypothetical protein
MKIPRRMRTVVIPIAIVGIVVWFLMDRLMLTLKMLEIASSVQLLVAVAQVFIGIAMTVTSLAGVSSFLFMRNSVLLHD